MSWRGTERPRPRPQLASPSARRQSLGRGPRWEGRPAPRELDRIAIGFGRPPQDGVNRRHAVDSVGAVGAGAPGSLGAVASFGAGAPGSFGAGAVASFGAGAVASFGCARPTLVDLVS